MMSLSSIRILSFGISQGLRRFPRERVLEIELVFRKERTALVPTVVLAEMETTVVKHRMSVSVEAFINSLDETGCRIVPFDEVVVRRYLSLRARLDIFDRIIVATALVYNAPLVTRDPMIVASATVPVVW